MPKKVKLLLIIELDINFLEGGHGWIRAIIDSEPLITKHAFLSDYQKETITSSNHAFL